MKKTQTLRKIDDAFAKLAPENTYEKDGLRKVFKSVGPLAKCVEKNCIQYEPSSVEAQNCLKKKCSKSLKQWERINKDYLNNLKNKFKHRRKTVRRSQLKHNIENVVDAVIPTEDRIFIGKKNEIDQLETTAYNFEKMNKPTRGRRKKSRKPKKTPKSKKKKKKSKKGKTKKN